MSLDATAQLARHPKAIPGNAYGQTDARDLLLLLLPKRSTTPWAWLLRGRG